MLVGMILSNENANRELESSGYPSLLEIAVETAFRLLSDGSFQRLAISNPSLDFVQTFFSANVVQVTFPCSTLVASSSRSNSDHVNVGRALRHSAALSPPTLFGSCASKTVCTPHLTDEERKMRFGAPE
jgi:hypothetical protein